MSDERSLIVAMAEKCAEMIVAHEDAALDQPKSLRPQHLLWMCREVLHHSDDWPATKIHRWIGFVQAAMIANRVMNLGEAKAMFDAAKNAYGSPTQDLLDHLDPESSFRLDLGGEG